MKEKWIKNEKRKDSDDGQPIAKKWNITTDSPIFHKQSKLLTNSPSLRAIRNYNDLPIDYQLDSRDSYGNNSNYEYHLNPNFSCHSNENVNSSGISYDNFYPTISSLSRSCRSNDSNHSNGSVNQLKIDDTGGEDEVQSTNQLIMTKMKQNIKSWCIHLSTIIYTISMACSLGNFYRLPQMTLLNGGIPFLIVYLILMLLIGLPLIFFELGIGQMSQEGFIKTWRAVPFFRGIGYLKLAIGCFVCIYYPLYITLGVMYFLWILKGAVPFNDCTNGVIMTTNGYYATTKTGQECLKNTFLKSPFVDPYYFGVFVVLLIFIWIFIAIMSLKRTRSFTTSLVLLFFPLLACYIILITKSILLETTIPVLYQYFQNIDWHLLTKFDIWYYATIQIFFSTNIGFGTFITNGGIIYNQVNPLWTAIGYILTSLTFGIGFIIMVNIFTLNGTGNMATNSATINEVQFFATIYDAMITKSNGSNHFQYWLIAIYFVFIFSGLISMATFTYSLLKAINGHNELRLSWWKLNTIFCTCGFFLSCILLLKDHFDLIHLLDHYIVGNLLIISVIFELAAFLILYGAKRIQSDFEFILGRILSKYWLVLWWVIPPLLTCIFIWNISINGRYANDPLWMYTIGWCTVLTALLLILLIGIFVVTKQDGYTIIDKLKSTFEPSHNWGPKDPMLRYNWVQWSAKSQSGEKDFTLKRQGTKDYTRTIKRQAKKKALKELCATSIAGAYVQMVNDGHPQNDATNNRKTEMINGGGEHQ